MKLHHYLAVTLLACLLIQGCSQTPVPQTVEVAPEPPPEEIAAPPVRPFPAETLYALLVAEMAGSRERYDVALGNYIQQAHKTRDPGVTARATRIARFLNAHQAALDTSLLWIQLEPTNNEAHLIAATELAQSGRLQEAFEHSRHLLENGATPIFQSLAARAATATDTQRELLLNQYDQLLDTHPEELQLLVGKGLLLQQNNRLEDALELARTAMEADPTHIPAAILEAKLLHQMNKPEQALERLVALLEQYPDNKRLRLQYARLLANFDLEKAHEQFAILVENSPGDPDLLFSLALVSNEQGLTEEAKTHFEALLKLGRRTSSAHYYLGRIAEQGEQLEQALMHYLRVDPGPDFMPALLQSTDILIRQEDFESAHHRLDELRQRYPSQAERFYLLESEVLTKYGHYNDAEGVLSQALNRLPTSTNLLYARAMINEKRNFIELTEHDLRAILRYEPNNATALNALGYTLADRTTRYEEAYELISQALNITPDDPAVIDSMGWVQYRLGNYEEAVLRLREAMKAFPDHEIAAHLGEVLWKSGKVQEARATWAEGLKLNPDSKVIPAVIERLESEAAQQPESFHPQSVSQ